MTAAMMLSLAACGSSSATASSAASSAGESSAAASEATKREDSSASEESAKDAAADSGKTYKIGVLQLVQHTALDKTNEGFIEALDASGISYEVDQQNAAGDTVTATTIAQKFVNDGDDLIYAIATQAAQAAASQTEDIPIVLNAVTDPAGSGLVADNAAPGGNVTGASDLTPVADQIKLIKKFLPDAKTVGILYCSAESNSEIQVKLAKEACQGEGLTAEEYPVANSNDIQTVVESMVGKVDVIYAPTDNVVAAGMATVAMIANDNKIPTVVGEQGMCDAGGLVTYTIDYKELGKVAGEMAVKILTEGADPATMPIEYYPSDKLQLVVNEETAKTLGLDLSGLEV